MKSRQTVSTLSLVIVALAFWLRFDRLATAPFGWHLDEASKGIMAREVLHGGPYPVFFSQFTGREGLFIYLEAGMFMLLGEGVFAGRVLNAFIGTLTVALTVPLGRALWPGTRGGVIGRWAAALLAASLWHLIASRNGYRAVLQPLAQLPALIVLLQTLRRDPLAVNHLRWIVVGFFTGLALYTYTAARVFPLVIALIGGAALWARAGRAARARGLLIALASAVVTAAPLLWYFYQHPDDFVGRAQQISYWNPVYAGGDPLGRLWQNVLDTLGMFGVRGDPNYRFNIANRPVFDPLLVALFYLGLGWMLIGLFRRAERFQALALLGWLALMLLPMTLSAEGLPYYQRAIGALPAVMVFPVVALERGAAWLAERLPVGNWRKPLGEAALLIPLGGLALWTRSQYFNEWHNVPGNDIDRHAALVYLADELTANPPPGAVTYIATDFPLNMTLAFLTPDAYAASQRFDARHALPLPPEAQSATYYLLNENPLSPNLRTLAGLAAGRVVEDRFGQPSFEIVERQAAWPKPAYTQMAWAWELTYPPGWQPSPLPAPVNLQNALELLGYELSATTASAGDELILILHWRLLGPLDREHSMFAHVLDPHGGAVAAYDGNGYLATAWQAGELLLSEFPLTIRPGTPPGEYQLEVGVYHQPTNEPLLVLVEGIQPVNGRVLLHPITVR